MGETRKQDDRKNRLSVVLGDRALGLVPKTDQAAPIPPTAPALLSPATKEVWRLLCLAQTPAAGNGDPRAPENRAAQQRDANRAAAADRAGPSSRPECAHSQRREPTTRDCDTRRPL